MELEMALFGVSIRVASLRVGAGFQNRGLTDSAARQATASSGRTVSVADPVASFNGTPCGSIVEYGVDFSTSDEE